MHASGYRAIYTGCVRLTRVRLYDEEWGPVASQSRKIFYEDRSTRHEILNEKNGRPSRGRKRVRLQCDWPVFFIM
ncbi:hypothetical protein Y032_0177g614 [Ancylostoma ceylanicum]|uniref:Uncharacterized protein n=1 Tax=Ancylostoma ceylanicum TaxID=53326 RepID=A0A016STE1_9BILA|nr:hypothetical protein Y032_0177g614 [Ancylostoma ceylanicum]